MCFDLEQLRESSSSRNTQRGQLGTGTKTRPVPQEIRIPSIHHGLHMVHVLGANLHAGQGFVCASSSGLSNPRGHLIELELTRGVATCARVGDQGCRGSWFSIKIVEKCALCVEAIRPIHDLI